MPSLALLSRRALLPLLAALLLTLGSALASAEQEAVAPPTIQQLGEQLQSRIADLRRIDDELQTAPARYQEPLEIRRDDRAFRALQDLEKLVQAVLALPADAADRQAGTEYVQQYLETAAERILQRVDTLGQRIDKGFDSLDELQGPERLQAEARVHSLQAKRFRYYSALVAVIEGIQSLQLPVQSLLDEVQPRLQLQAEALVGRMEFNGQVLRELRGRQPQQRDNADLNTAISTLSAQQKTDIANLTTMIALLERLQVPTQDYRATLVQQGQGLSLATLESGAITTLLQETWDSVRESLGTTAPNLVFNVVVFVLIVVTFYTLGRFAKRGVRATFERPGVRMSTLHKNTLISLTGGTVTLVGFLIALAQMGISLGPMLAGLGVAGFIVGFALQDTLGNFASGAMILIYRPFDVDDYVEVAGVAGFVKKMSLVSTTIATFDNQTLVVPNTKIWGDVIKNVTAQKVRRVDLKFGVSYGDDVPHVERVLREIVAAHEKILETPETNIRLHEMGDSSVNFIVRPWVRTEDYWDVYWDLTREVKVRFDAEGISIPFPQRDVHFYPATADAEAALDDARRDDEPG
ncbi:mechanosensitive ion channel [Mangrovimicrobium sediminis]|uniref:Small-conductance mechanosensitive channel n=1 Tax=Mangrovimicrobium sediminis TaxID=2562682 RepID=A0A4Z0M5K6_9GAMM|nr:mechanosensitive ion channel family protein [Haliea sp. SAOS-164]TGD74697.1 mechanosensitive ion channel [Haliea sp. SAOS-164]